MVAPIRHFDRRTVAASARLLLGLLVLGLLALSGLLDASRVAAADERELILTPGFNQVVYTGPDTGAAQAAEQIPGLRAIYRWDASAQGYRSYSPLLPGNGGDLQTLRWGDALWLDLTLNSVWTMPVVEGPRHADLVRWLEPGRLGRQSSHSSRSAAQLSE